MVVTRSKKKVLQKYLISPSNISNSIKNDKILDYLDIVDKSGYIVSNELIIEKKQNNNNENYNSDDKTIGKKRLRIENNDINLHNEQQNNKKKNHHLIIFLKMAIFLNMILLIK